MSDVTFEVGDLCTCQYDDRGGGLLYKVEETYVDGTVKIKPIHGVLVDTKNRKTRVLHGGWCQKITRVELANLVEQLNEFIAIETIIDSTIPRINA